MAWDGSTRRSRLPDDWAIRRVRVLRRDGYRCQARYSDGSLCGELANQADHIVAGDNHDLDNLQALCAYHHGQKSSSEGRAARTYRRQAREPEQHPGAAAARRVRDVPPF